MNWQQLIIRTDDKHSELISNILTDNGSDAVTIQDAEDQPIFEPPLDAMLLWSQLRVTGLFSALQDLQPVVELITKKLGFEPEHKIEILEDKDWIRAWMDDFKPMQFGKKLWICPSWHQPPDKNAVNILLDPGLAFGTGTHPTTSLCLRWLDQYSDLQPIQQQNFIDYGCGSGILSVAALKLGAQAVYAVDIDIQAIQASIDNAIKNQQQDKLFTFLPAAFDQQHKDLLCDVLMANILSAPLLELGEFFASKIKTGGRIVLSGILFEQAEKIVFHYQQWFHLDPIEKQDDWIRVSGIKI
ncbi:MAG: 50S ribosomal protein L11 methyltransferase [Pseudomonadota bacterium]